VQTDTAGYKSLFLVSILKNIQVVTNTVVLQAAKGGTFDNSQYVGNLKNNGVGLSSFHGYASKVPSGLDADLTKIKQGISDGSITVTSKSSFK
jgi:basic membrane protein A